MSYITAGLLLCGVPSLHPLLHLFHLSLHLYFSFSFQDTLGSYHIHELRQISSESRLLPLGPKPSASPLSPCHPLSSPGFIWQALQRSAGKRVERTYVAKQRAQLFRLRLFRLPGRDKPAGLSVHDPPGRLHAAHWPTTQSIYKLLPQPSRRVVAPKAELWSQPFRVPVPHQGREERRNRRDLMTLAPRRRTLMVSSRARPLAGDPFPSCTRAWGEGLVLEPAAGRRREMRWWRWWDGGRGALDSSKRLRVWWRYGSARGCSPPRALWARKRHEVTHHLVWSLGLSTAEWGVFHLFKTFPIEPLATFYMWKDETHNK